ncbi:N-acetylmuramic acid 6-phosphate etherase [Acidomonas methanolica]|uniref:N-acetylmuramic acid 6-phosphate etherase n=2 Tax=Acidomonas methanolica TaxID=437 RepID=A0A023D529_ACIMT|nr:N-acetylmuramic acid 6-phosphate etherase [Acidomonas methanolica]MBU2653724.1 N-acetylmuramic acid 6-phosphate etherase [Acidomonas methanolica]TCS31676.1 N-acetylmuramic acid 6-phosphate etherase [Acidomonas methanolica]GAJ28890.1 N-acetylmuramic acid 6-phosphate etherase [Acidomonas methanolica NBRC 104435]GEK98094.1 N-acetylmuramic acid 6-phosphate etherase [Acidomonas methanolica NBRC 104435]
MIRTEEADLRYADLDVWPVESVLDALGEAQMTATAVARAAAPQIARAVEAAAPRIAAGGRLVYVGAGTSGRIGMQDGVELTPTFGFPVERLVLLLAGGAEAVAQAVEGAEDDEAAARRDLLARGPGENDVVIGVAASGSTPYTCAAIEAARVCGSLTIGVSNTPDGRLLELAACPVSLPTGPEVVAGSTRLKAGTAQKAALNMFSTALMIRLGHVHRGMMVDMKVTNAKLARRAARMVATLAGGTEAEIAGALDAAGGNVKRAVLLRTGCPEGEVEARLARHGGSLRRALEQP